MYQIPEHVLGALITYLAAQPYKDVHQIIPVLQQLEKVPPTPAPADAAPEKE